MSENIPNGTFNSHRLISHLGRIGSFFPEKSPVIQLIYYKFEKKIASK